MSQQPVRQAARRSALDAQAVLRTTHRPGRRPEAWMVDVLTALGERDVAVGTRSSALAARCWR